MQDGWYQYKEGSRAVFLVKDGEVYFTQGYTDEEPVLYGPVKRIIEVRGKTFSEYALPIEFMKGF